MHSANAHSTPGTTWRTVRAAAVAVTLAVTAACGSTATQVASAPSPAHAAASSPEALGAVLGKRAVGDKGMVASAHPSASEAGQEILRAGGTAVDAALATAFAIGVVEPMMSGLGGSGGMVIWDAITDNADFVEFYATSGARISTEPNRGPARMVGVPGEVAGLLAAHAKYGRLPLATVMAPAIRLAESGYPAHAMLARVAQGDSAKLASSAPRAREIFLPGGRPVPAGAMIRQPELAATLRRISVEGRDGFYRGPVAEEIVRTIQADGNPITLDDLANYKERWRRPICGDYLGRTVITAAPPLSGSEVVETLNLFESYPWASLGFPQRDARAFDAMVTSIRAARADRNAHAGDPAFTFWPASVFASNEYAARRVAQAAARPQEQTPGDYSGIRPAPTGMCATIDPWTDVAVSGSASAPRTPETSDSEDNLHDGAETTHISVVDAEGSAVSLTITQGLYFGSGAWAAGTFLNSAMGNFSSPSSSRNPLGPNRIASTTISPTIVLDGGGDVEVVVGSPASGRIPPAISQTLLYTLQYGMDPYAAVSMPRVYPATGNREVQLEQGFNGNVLAGAYSLGWVIRQHTPIDHFFGGVAVLLRRDGKWIGAADPRRSGEVRAQ